MATAGICSAAASGFFRGARRYRDRCSPNELHPSVEVSYRDLAATPLGHLSGAHLAAVQGAVPADTAVEKDIARGVAMLDEFPAANIVERALGARFPPSSPRPPGPQYTPCCRDL